MSFTSSSFTFRLELNRAIPFKRQSFQKLFLLITHQNETSYGIKILCSITTKIIKVSTGFQHLGFHDGNCNTKKKKTNYIFHDIKILKLT